jgi:hypothetical protein
MNTEHDRPEGAISAFTANLISLLDAVDQCLQKQLVLPTLALIYTGIDVVASLERKDSDGVQEYFTQWTDRYLLPHLDANVTALDIYAARCGIIHHFSATSRLFQQGRARQIAYAWGNASVAELRKAVMRTGRKMPALHLSLLAKAYRLAVADWIDDISKDPARASLVESRSESQWFKNLTTQQVATFNQTPRRGFRTSAGRRTRGQPRP